MNLNAKDLKKIMYDYNRVSERLMHTDFADFSNNIKRFIDFIDNNKIIKEFVDEAGKPTFDINVEVSEVSHGTATFEIGNDNRSEIANIYCIMHYIVDHGLSYNSMIFYGYGHGSNKFQDMIDDFNSRVTMVLFSHIEAFLTSLGYDMGLDQRNINYNFNGSFNSIGLQQGNNNTMINNVEATLDFDEVKKIIEEIRKNQGSFDAAFGNDSKRFNSELTELESSVEKKDSAKAKKLLLSLKAIAEGAAGNLIASGVIALLSGVLSNL